MNLWDVTAVTEKQERVVNKWSWKKIVIHYSYGKKMKMDPCLTLYQLQTD